MPRPLQSNKYVRVISNQILYHPFIIIVTFYCECFFDAIAKSENSQNTIKINPYKFHRYHDVISFKIVKVHEQALWQVVVYLAPTSSIDSEDFQHLSHLAITVLHKATNMKLMSLAGLQLSIISLRFLKE